MSFWELQGGKPFLIMQSSLYHTAREIKIKAKLSCGSGTARIPPRLRLGSFYNIVCSLQNSKKVVTASLLAATERSISEDGVAASLRSSRIS